MRAPILALILAVAVGIGAVTMMRMGPKDAPAESASLRESDGPAGRLLPDAASEIDPDSVTQAVNSLIQILDEEIHERRILAEQLDELRAEMADLKQNLRARVEESFAAEGMDAVNVEQEGPFGQSRDTRFAAVGFTPEQVEGIRRLEAEAQMREIELDDRARREGWVNTPRYFAEFNKLTSDADTLRRDLGDDGYDRYLFASGRPNRIAISTIIEMSPAAKAGLRPGDVIKSYGGERVFTNEQLVNLRSAGDRGVPVTVEIVRDGQAMQITMPRGPMGFYVQPDIVDPAGG